MTNFKVYLKGMELTGLKGLDIDSMRFNLGWMHVDVVMSIPKLRLTGQNYRMSGKIMLVPVHGEATTILFGPELMCSNLGNGAFYMDVNKLKIFAKANLARNQTSNKLEVDQIVLDMDVGDLDMHFDNLMGSRRWSSIANEVLNQMSHLIFDHVKYSLLDELKEDIKSHLNAQLDKLPNDFVHTQQQVLFDALIDKLNEEIRTAGFDPLKLDDQEEKFYHNLQLFKFYGRAEVHNGILHGLSTLCRNPDDSVIAVYENDSVTLEASLGFENLTGSYDWSLSLMGAGPGGELMLHVSKIKVSNNCFRPFLIIYFPIRPSSSCDKD